MAKIDKNAGTALSPQVIRELLRQTPPCWGHYGKMNCLNQGFLKYERGPDGIQHFKKCPFEHSCKRKSLQYMKHCDPYEHGKIDKPRELIRELDKV